MAFSKLVINTSQSSTQVPEMAGTPSRKKGTEWAECHNNMSSGRRMSSSEIKKNDRAQSRHVRAMSADPELSQGRQPHKKKRSSDDNNTNRSESHFTRSSFYSRSRSSQMDKNGQYRKQGKSTRYLSGLGTSQYHDDNGKDSRERSNSLLTLYGSLSQVRHCSQGMSQTGSYLRESIHNDTGRSESWATAYGAPTAYLQARLLAPATPVVQSAFSVHSCFRPNWTAARRWSLVEFRTAEPPPYRNTSMTNLAMGCCYYNCCDGCCEREAARRQQELQLLELRQELSEGRSGINHLIHRYESVAGLAMPDIPCVGHRELPARMLTWSTPRPSHYSSCELRFKTSDFVDTRSPNTPFCPGVPTRRFSLSTTDIITVECESRGAPMPHRWADTERVSWTKSGPWPGPGTRRDISGAPFARNLKIYAFSGPFSWSTSDLQSSGHRASNPPRSISADGICLVRTEEPFQTLYVTQSRNQVSALEGRPGPGEATESWGPALSVDASSSCRLLVTTFHDEHGSKCLDCGQARPYEDQQRARSAERKGEEKPASFRVVRAHKSGDEREPERVDERRPPTPARKFINLEISALLDRSLASDYSLESISTREDGAVSNAPKSSNLRAKKTQKPGLEGTGFEMETKEPSAGYAPFVFETKTAAPVKPITWATPSRSGTDSTAYSPFTVSTKPCTPQKSSSSVEGTTPGSPPCEFASQPGVAQHSLAPGESYVDAPAWPSSCDFLWNALSECGGQLATVTSEPFQDITLCAGAPHGAVPSTSQDWRPAVEPRSDFCQDAAEALACDFADRSPDCLTDDVPDTYPPSYQEQSVLRGILRDRKGNQEVCDGYVEGEPEESNEPHRESSSRPSGSSNAHRRDQDTKRISSDSLFDVASARTAVLDSSVDTYKVKNLTGKTFVTEYWDDEMGFGLPPGADNSPSSSDEDVSQRQSQHSVESQGQWDTDPETGIPELTIESPCDSEPLEEPDAEPLDEPPSEIAPVFAIVQQLEPQIAPVVGEVEDDALLLEVEKEALQSDRIIQEYSETTFQIYPEVSIVLLLALLCIAWILFVLLSSFVRHAQPTPSSIKPTINVTCSEDTGERSSNEIDHSTSATATSTSTTEEPLKEVYLCTSDFCVKEGNYIKPLITQSSAQPCDDFYDHVCSVWQKAAAEAKKASGQLPGASVSTDTRLQGDMEARLLSYVADPKHADVAPARRLYESCLDRPSTQLAPQQASEQFRKWRIGSWPRTDVGSPTDVWVFAAELVRDLGVEAFLGVTLGLDPRTLDKAIVELGPPKPLFFASDISQQQVLSIFSSAVRESATQLWPGSVAPADKAAEDVRMVLAALAALRLNDKGDSPDDYELMAFNSMGTGLREFLQTIFANLNNFDPTTQILTRHGRVVPKELEETVSNLPARAVLNYLGLRALLPLAPFLPDIVPLQLLHAIDVLGRPELANASVMCLRAVGQALPACLAAALRSTMVTEEPKRQVWLNQLEALFLDAVKKVIWLDELSTLLVRYKMRHHRLARFSPLQGVCRQPQGAVAASPLAVFIQISKLHRQGELQQIRHFPLPPTTGSSLDVWPTYKLSQQLMHIPAGLVNASVPSNSTFFALHLSRLGTRFFAALTKLLYDSTVYELETPLRFTPDAQVALDRLLDCIVQDARPLFGHRQDPSHLRLALLEQVLAIQLAFLAFRQLLGTRRIWRRDFRLAPLPDVSSDKLFFIYYALDHCELSDDLFSRHEAEAHRRLPAKQRVNVALRQSPAFARAFSCQAGAPMTTTSLCQVLR